MGDWLDQHLVALDYANKIRIGRAKIKRELKAGQVGIRALILDPPDSIKSATVYEIITSMNRWGQYRARKILAVAGVTEYTTMGSLTDRQRFSLIAELP